MDESKLLLAARDRMALRELACMWAQELGVSWPELERRLLWACNSGQFGSDFLVCDTYFLRRDDVLGFARRLGLEPPSWWLDQSGIDSIDTHCGFDTHCGTINEILLTKKLDKEAVRALVQKQIRYDYETFEQAWHEISGALKHRGRPRKKPS
jgi:hypothetical protein